MNDKPTNCNLGVFVHGGPEMGDDLIGLRAESSLRVMSSEAVPH